MARLGQTFRADEHDTEQQEFELLPTGIYKLEVSASDIKEEGNNINLSVTMDVIEPAEYAKRKIFVYMDLQHDDAEYQGRGQKEFAKLCRAVGVQNCDDSEELHFIEFTAKVKKGEAGVGKKSGKPYKARNSISRYYYPDVDDIPEPAIDESQPTPTRQPAANDNRAPAANDNRRQEPAKAAGSRPWGQKK